MHARHATRHATRHTTRHATRHAGRQTGSYALLFNATYVSTLQFTLGFNYLTLLQLGQWSESKFAVPDCAFTNVTGSMDVLPVLGSSFFGGMQRNLGKPS